MSDTYIAWNGDEYPLPAPDGWELKSDGRYWPADREPLQPQPRAAQPTNAPPPTAPQTAPPPAVFAPPPGVGGAMPPPAAAAPPPGAPPTAPQWAPPTPQKKSNAGKIILGIVALIVLGVGACSVIAVRAGEGFFNAIEDFTEEIDAARRSVAVETCGAENGELVASGTITNERTVETGYQFAIVFVQSDGSRDRTRSTEIGQVAPGETKEWRIANPLPTGIGEVTCEVVDMSIEPLSFGN